MREGGKLGPHEFVVAPKLQKLLAFAPKLKLPLKRHAEKLVKARDTDGVVAGCLKLLGL